MLISPYIYIDGKPQTYPNGTLKSETINTQQCISCGKKAHVFCGHVTIGESIEIIAGWCSDECHKNKQIKYEAYEGEGCYGPWLEEYGFSINIWNK